MPYQKNDCVFSSLNFEAISVGLEKSLFHTITQSDVDTFASLTGDYNPVHMDPEYAAQTLFGRNVVHGMLTSSFVSTMIGMLIPGPGALWTSQQIEFLNPSFVGDTITVKAQVIQKSESTRSIVLELEIINQKNIKVVTGKSTVKMLELKKKRTEGIMNRITLITGAGTGIGQATAIKLAKEGHSIIVNYRHSKDEAGQLVNKIRESGGRALSVMADISKVSEVENLVLTVKKEWGNINGVVHCAAPKPVPEAITNFSWEKYEENFSIQLKGAFNCMRAIVPSMLEQGQGSIVFIGSIFTHGTPPTQQSAYIVAKAALEMYAKTLAAELGPKGIRVNVVSPGMTFTKMIAEIPEKTKLVAKMNTPLRKLAEPEDVANSVAFLLSDAAGHISGETLKVCGGINM